jgi:ABC-type transport system involved in cytochrome bd biosynthesis fused ATPase/permease subunit
MLTNPSVLLLDDATASVDPETEHEIREAMVSAMRGRTTIIVSNRLSTLRQTDRIVVLRDGVIEAMGPHDELLRTSVYYCELSDLQSRHELEQIEPAPDESASEGEAMTIQMTGANRVSGRRMTRVV